MRWAGHVDYSDRELRCIQEFGEETWGRQPTWKTKAYRWGDNIKMCFKDVGWGID
jgi:hypothetical protein